MKKEKLPYFNYNEDVRRLEAICQRGIWVKPLNEDKIWLSDIAKKILEIKSKERTFPLSFFSASITASDRQHFSILVKESMRTLTVQSFELRYLYHSNNSRKTKYLQLNFGADKNKEGKMFLMGTMYDITRQKKKEEELERVKEKLDESDSLMNYFLANLSYEIRNPVNTILGFSELASLHDVDENKRKEYIQLAIRRCKELIGLLDDIIDLSKFESGQVTFNIIPCKIESLIGDAVSFFDNTVRYFSKEHVTLKTDVATHLLSHTIYSDYGRLQQVLHLVLEHAILRSEKGVITLGCHKKKEDKDNIFFYVTDAGPRLSQEEQKTLFYPFRKMDFPSGKKAGESGIRLILARYIIEALKGTIGANAESEKGITVFFSLPENSHFKPPATEKFHEEKKPATYLWKNKVILVVEDEEINFRFIEAVLNSTSVQLVHASTGKEAVELCRSLPRIDLVLLDLKMPGMNGFETLKEIKSLRKIPVIAQSAYTLQEIQSLGKRSGFDDFLTKPLDIQTLLSTIDKYLSNVAE